MATSVQVTSQSQKHLEAVLGSCPFGGGGIACQNRSKSGQWNWNNCKSLLTVTLRLCTEIGHHVSAWLSVSHTPPSQSIVRGHHRPVQRRRQGPHRGLNNFVSMYLTCLILLLCFFMSPLYPRQCACVPMY